MARGKFCNKRTQFTGNLNRVKMKRKNNVYLNKGILTFFCFEKVKLTKYQI